MSLPEIEVVRKGRTAPKKKITFQPINIEPPRPDSSLPDQTFSTDKSHSRMSSPKIASKLKNIFKVASPRLISKKSSQNGDLVSEPNPEPSVDKPRKTVFSNLSIKVGNLKESEMQPAQLKAEMMDTWKKKDFKQFESTMKSGKGKQEPWDYMDYERNEWVLKFEEVDLLQHQCQSFKHPCITVSTLKTGKVRAHTIFDKITF